MQLGLRRNEVMVSVKSFAFVSLFAAAMAPAAHAADPGYYPLPASQPLVSQPVEFGTGWYLRGDVGATHKNTPTLDASGSLLSISDSRNAWTGGLGIGYSWNNWFRTDATLDYSASTKTSVSTLLNSAGNPIICPYALDGLSTQALVPVQLGYAYNPNDTCRNDKSAKQTRLTFLVNGYVDLGTWAGITPYIGAGVGVTGTQIRGYSNYYKTSDGTPYRADLTPTGTYPLIWVTPQGTTVTPQPNIAFAKQNWDRAQRQRLYRFAWALTGGFAYDFAPHLKLDVSYRFTNLGSYSVMNATTGAVTNKIATTQDVRVGVRWTPDL
jgi:opacity protein-like surface antigen